MKRARIAAAALGLFVAGLAGAASVAEAKDQTLKELMGQNFAGLQTILIALITSNYSSVLPQVEIIRDHATALTKLVPANAQADRDRFLSYAYELRTRADDLEVISRALIAHDKGKEHNLVTDPLRDAAAAHYGFIVTTCVSCHNRFRPDVVH
jgi:cytochrome c556